MKLSLTPFWTLPTGTLAAIGISASSAFAQDNTSTKLQLEEVIVTAEKRSQDVQSIPLAITAFSQDDMNLREANDMRALQNYTPNLEFNNESGGQNNARITLRGIGTETLVGGGDPGVALHVDGVYVGRNSAAAQSAFDIERLEVLRGPQGTLYGRNATGGSINIVTKKATDEFEVFGDVTAGNYARRRVRGVLNAPLSDNVFSRFSVVKDDRDGYLENLAGGGDNDDKDVLGVRGQLLWDLEDDNQIILRAFYNKSEGVGAGSRWLGSDIGFQQPDYLLGVSDGSVGPPPGVPITGPLYTQPASGSPAAPISMDLYEIRKNADEFVDATQQGVDLTVEWSLSDSVMLRSISALQSNDNDTLVDADNSELDIETRARVNEADQWSQEFNLISTADSSLDWILGAFIYHEEIEESLTTFTPGGLLDPSIPLPGGQLPGGNGAGQSPLAKHEADAYAVFGQATYSLLDSLRLTAGLRYSEDEKEQARSNAGIRDNVTDVELTTGIVGQQADESASDSWTSVTGKLAIDYDLNENSLLFASYSRGYKSGGIPFNGIMEPYEPEVVDAFEIGSKNELLDNRVRLNIAAFLYDYQDLQVFRLTGDGPRAENAAQSSVWGVEVEFQAVLTENLKIDGSAGYLNAEYDDYTIDIPPSDFSGNTLNHAPEYMFNMGIQYDLDLANGGLTARVDYVRKGDTYFDRANGPFDIQEAFGLLNANIRYELNSWFVALYGKNLGDEEYITGQIINPPFSCGCRTVGVGEPRTYGLTVGYRMD